MATLSEPRNAKADIVFVHGLQGHPYSTWAHPVPSDTKDTGEPSNNQRQLQRPRFLSKLLGKKTAPNDDATHSGESVASTAQNILEVYWPKDLLAAEDWCKSGRILTYGYDSRVIRGYASVNKNGLFAHANDLLYNLQREKPQGRPVIFVCHSLGGVIVKEMLRRSNESEESDLKDIVGSTKGIIFLGTPHRGSSDFVSLGDTVRRVASAVARVDSNSALLRSLGADSPELELGRDSFVVLWRTYNFRVKTFQEGFGLSGFSVGLANEKVVPDISSALGDPREHVETISANHIGMAKFRGVSDNGYRAVSSEIKTMLKAGMEGVRQLHQKIKDDLLRSLSFPEIYDRQKNIRDALSQTTDWLFNHPKYLAWIDRKNIAKHHGLLWMKGKPGAGKSTLMKTAFMRLQLNSEASGILIAAFFFNARSPQPLEKTPMGLYRSLLYQVLRQGHNALSCLFKEPAFDENGNVKWHQAELQGYLKQVLVTPASKPVFLFIDAMDECDEKEVRDLVSYFSQLVKEASHLGASLNVCLSSRHYPQISVDWCPEIVVEHHNEQDILRFIQAEAADYALIYGLQKEIRDKSGGVFLWVVLTISILKRSGRGKSRKWLMEKLTRTPPELTTLFKTLFSDINKDDLPRTINLMYFMLFSEWPLDQDQIHAGLSFSLEAHPSKAAWKDSVDYLDTANSRHELIIELSKGLLEPTAASVGPTGCTYQFIHETVRDFFLSGEGFKLLQLQTQSITGSGHDTIAWACARYLNVDEIRGLEGNKRQIMSTLKPDDPFAVYASAFLIIHIELSITFGDFGGSILVYLDTQKLLPRLLDLDKEIVYGSDSMYVAAREGYLHIAMKLHQMGFDINSRCDATERYPLLIATRMLVLLRAGDKSRLAAMIRWLLKNGADTTVCNRFGETVLHIASTGRSSILKEILQYKHDVNARDNRGQTPLQIAIRCGDFEEGIVRLLIAHGADTHAVDNNGRTALMILGDHPRQTRGRIALTRILVEADCPLTARDLQGQTVLHHLANKTFDGCTRSAMYRYLVGAGADPVARDNYDNVVPVDFRLRRRSSSSVMDDKRATQRMPSDEVMEWVMTSG
ncbi:hypothetical protein NUW58_g1724 [Xylaria curta]|uniref:Uncharacterized protein n=1 Tax=Xylaria curta TaxID=42375 RepID=A0ACC1PLN1_9PEZI|nr:hypothetical protein NUW58_g1724 [Xylaria curta]